MADYSNSWSTSIIDEFYKKIYHEEMVVFLLETIEQEEKLPTSEQIILPELTKILTEAKIYKTIDQCFTVE